MSKDAKVFDPLMSLTDATVALGCSRHSLYREDFLLSIGLRRLKIGGRYKFRVRDIEAVLERAELQFGEVDNFSHLQGELFEAGSADGAE
jgi:hypothetical protein